MDLDLDPDPLFTWDLLNLDNKLIYYFIFCMGGLRLKTIHFQIPFRSSVSPCHDCIAQYAQYA
jgi:hypothetical protein